MTGYSPHQLVFGSYPADFILMQLQIDKVYPTLKNGNYKSYLFKLRKLIQKRLNHSLVQQKKYDSRRKTKYNFGRKRTTFKRGELVIVYIGDRYHGNSKKLLQLFDGPYTIIDTRYSNKDLYIVRRNGQNFTSIVHVSKLEPFKERTLKLFE